LEKEDLSRSLYLFFGGLTTFSTAHGDSYVCIYLVAFGLGRWEIVNHVQTAYMSLQIA
jgi:hypothetical protein